MYSTNRDGLALRFSVNVASLFGFTSYEALARRPWLVARSSGARSMALEPAPCNGPHVAPDPASFLRRAPELAPTRRHPHSSSFRFAFSQFRSSSSRRSGIPADVPAGSRVLHNRISHSHLALASGTRICGTRIWHSHQSLAAIYCS